MIVPTVVLMGMVVGVRLVAMLVHASKAMLVGSRTMIVRLRVLIR